MTTISRQLNLPYSAAQMYALVNDVARYPEFVPFCSSAVIHEADASSMRASLIIEWQAVQYSLTTANKLIENQKITMNLAQGLMKNLKGEWQFIAKGEHECEVKLAIDLEFNNRLVGFVFTKVVQQVLNRITDAFVERAKFLYGKKTS
ncbi:MAG: type II toxin-antitoxin system RatA family toxin [Gammaproteobacteria bacterium]|jgi:ribosome-associated toxin RatA of RatAB toxin-antitoxin module